MKIILILNLLYESKCINFCGDCLNYFQGKCLFINIFASQFNEVEYMFHQYPDSRPSIAGVEINAPIF